MSNEQKQTIDACWPIALAVARHVRVYAQERGHDAGLRVQNFALPDRWDGDTYEVAAFRKPGEIEYRLHAGCAVRVVNLDIANVSPENVEVGRITPIGDPRIVASRVMESPNDTADDIPWEFTYRDLVANTQVATIAKEVGASITAGLRQSIGYGGEMYGIQGETELSVQAEASVRAAWEDAMTTHREIEIESVRSIIQRAGMNTIIERVESVGPAKQIIRARGELKFGFAMWSGDQWQHQWDTTPIYLAQAIGIETDGDNPWTHIFRNSPTSERLLEPIRTPVYATVEKVREFQNVTNIETRFRTEPISNEQALRHAYSVLAERGDGEMQRMAAEQLKAA